jgi:DNA-binding IclR family transcriptional regulator
MLPHDQETQFLDHIRTYPGMTAGDMGRKFRIARRTVATMLIKLESEGKVRFDKEPCSWSSTGYQVKWYVI